MDDWNDFGGSTPGAGTPTTATPPSLRDFRDNDHLRRHSSGISADQSSTDGEPRSVLFRTAPTNGEIGTDDLSALTTKPDNPMNQQHHDNRMSQTGTYLDGEMDDDSDFEELVFSSLRNTSSSYRFHKRSYTKLEVISSVQIQQIVHFFHIVIAVALSWTVFSIIVCNAMYANTVPLPVLPALLSKDQLELVVNPSARFSTVPTKLQRQSSPLFNVNGVQLRDERYWNIAHIPPWWDKEFDPYDNVECVYRGVGLSYISNEWRRTYQPMDCEDTTHPCYQYWKRECELRKTLTSSTLNTTNRQESQGMVPTRPISGRYLFIPMRTLVVDSWYKALAHIVWFIIGLSLLVLGTLFALRLSRTGRANISQEQIFACILMFSTALYFNIFEAVIQLYITLTSTQDLTHPVALFLISLTQPNKVFRELGLGPLFMLYFWSNIHAYRILDPAEKMGIGFYLPKIALLGPYFVIKCMSYFSANLWLSESPFISALVMFHSYRGFQVWKVQKVLCLYVIIVTLLDIAYVTIVIVEAIKTVRVLRRAPYMKHRSKQIGFRFFVYLAGAYSFTFYVLHLLLIVGRPPGEVLASNFIASVETATVYHAHLVGPFLLTFGYVVISAFVNLPYDSVGPLSGWIKGVELPPSSSRWTFSSDESTSDTDSKYGGGAVTSNTSFSSSYPGFRSNTPREQQLPTFVVDKDYELMREIIEPITYRKRESDDALELKANCFTMQTHVILFNFAWYVYYYGTPKCENFNPAETILPFKFSVSEHICEPSTDTHALVIDASDRILVSFKGTTSMRNLKTSMKIYHESLVKVVPTDIDGVDELHRLRIVFGRSYEAAKIHKGFALAYASVAHRVITKIKKLIDEQPRPVFLTGHSLGGALATICSLDVWIKLRISRRQIFVSTFGSPRVGNEAFSRIYDSVIALHWRIVVDSDMVAKLPKGMFRHVGKKVLLTPHGQMFIDPSALELKLWSGSTAGLAYHRKASYLLAMRAWCVRHHKKTYTPAFWPFPVRDEDKQRFEYSGINEDGHSFSDTSSRTNSLMAKKIVLRDTMVDSLDDHMNVNMEAVEKWARLTRRLLLRSKLEER